MFTLNSLYKHENINWFIFLDNNTGRQTHWIPYTQSFYWSSVEMKLHIGLLIVIAGSLARLEAATFPLTFRLCAYRLDGSKERFESVGYQDEERMFLGQSRFDDTKFGWAGHGVNLGATGETRTAQIVRVYQKMIFI